MIYQISESTLVSSTRSPTVTLSDLKDAEPVLKLSRERTNLFLYLCDLLCNLAQYHIFRSHLYMLSSNVSTRVATLLSARDKHLRLCAPQYLRLRSMVSHTLFLAAFRFFRICIKLNNKNYLNHLMKVDVFKPILELTLQESHRDSLLSATCQELFEYMRRVCLSLVKAAVVFTMPCQENIKELIHHCMTKHDAIIQQLATVPLGAPRFMAFIRRWEINIEPPPPEEVRPNRYVTGCCGPILSANCLQGEQRVFPYWPSN